MGLDTSFAANPTLPIIFLKSGRICSEIPLAGKTEMPVVVALNDMLGDPGGGQSRGNRAMAASL